MPLNPFRPNPFQQWTPHPTPFDPTWTTDMSPVPEDVGFLRQYYQSRTPTFLRNLGVPPAGTPEFEAFIQQEFNTLANERMRGYGPNPNMPAMPSRNAMLPFIPGGAAALWQQMQQGQASGPFGAQPPTPFGPFGPGRYTPQPDENMGSY